MTSTHEAYQARTYFPELDGLRAYCVLGVITAHLSDLEPWQTLSGGLGVYVFFVLSGYLITMLALREEGSRGRVNLTAFYVRRTMRIFPLYYFAVAIYCVLLFGTNWGASQRQNFADALPWYLTYLQEVPYAYHLIAEGRLNPFAHSWSLGIEEKYYLVWPLLAFIWWRGTRGMRLWGTVALTVLFAATQSVGRLDPRIAEWRLETVIYPYSHILWGCLLAILLHDKKWFDCLKVLGTPLGLVVSLAAFAACQWQYYPRRFDFHEIMIFHALATTMLIASLLTWRSPIVRFLEWRPSVFVGRISYGIYLFHGLAISAAQKAIQVAFKETPGELSWPLVILAFVLSAAISIGVATGLYFVLEKPMIVVGRRWSKAIMARTLGREA